MNGGKLVLVKNWGRVEEAQRNIKTWVGNIESKIFFCLGPGPRKTRGRKVLTELLVSVQLETQDEAHHWHLLVAELVSGPVEVIVGRICKQSCTAKINGINKTVGSWWYLKENKTFYVLSSPSEIPIYPQIIDSLQGTQISFKTIPLRNFV